VTYSTDSIKEEANNEGSDDHIPYAAQCRVDCLPDCRCFGCELAEPSHIQTPPVPTSSSTFQRLTSFLRYTDRYTDRYDSDGDQAEPPFGYQPTQAETRAAA
jgi:hypothetical protein